MNDGTEWVVWAAWRVKRRSKAVWRAYGVCGVIKRKVLR